MDDYYDDPAFDLADEVNYFDFYLPTFNDVWQTCMHPSIVQIVQYMSTLFLWNVAFRLTSQSGKQF